MGDDLTWTVDAGRVMWDVLDDEAVIIDLASGHYHAASGVTLTVWEALTTGATTGQLEARVRRCHLDVPDDAADHIAGFVDDLRSRGLVASAPTGAPPSPDPDTIPASTGAPSPHDGVPSSATPWQPLGLESHDDLEDLLVLDPVHDVTQDGWPNARPAG